MSDAAKSEDEGNRCPVCETAGEEMSHRDGYSCRNDDCPLIAFGTGEMPGVNQAKPIGGGLP